MEGCRSDLPVPGESYPFETVHGALQREELIGGAVCTGPAGAAAMMPQKAGFVQREDRCGACESVRCVGPVPALAEGLPKPTKGYTIARTERPLSIRRSL